MNKAKFQLLYSLSILILIPALLALNTIYLATSIRTDYDNEVQTRAELANSTMAISMQDYIEADNQELASSRLEKIDKAQAELQKIAIIVKDGNSYRVFASLEEDFEISNFDKLQYDISYNRSRSVAVNIAATTAEGTKTRAWKVVTPVMNDLDEVIGLVSSDYIAVDIDEKFDETLINSFIVLVLTTGAVIVLLLNHSRLIKNVSLLHKQKELNQTMSDFLSVATHELKAPMSMIKGYISNVLDGDFGKVSKPVKEQLNVAVVQTDRLNELVKDLLNVSRIEQGKIAFDIKPVNASNIIRTIASTYKATASEKGIEIDYLNDGADVWLTADEGRVQEIFTNLIDNAVKYSLEGEVKIQHELDGKHIITSVRDTGIGMTAEERNRLFQRFYRVKNDKTKGISGTGLGLWIIKQYIEKMGGKISVDSLVGSGTEFRVSLPASQEHAESE